MDQQNHKPSSINPPKNPASFARYSSYHSSFNSHTRFIRNPQSTFLAILLVKRCVFSCVLVQKMTWGFHFKVFFEGLWVVLLLYISRFSFLLLNIAVFFLCEMGWQFDFVKNEGLDVVDFAGEVQFKCCSFVSFFLNALQCFHY